MRHRSKTMFMLRVVLTLTFFVYLIISCNPKKQKMTIRTISTTEKEVSFDADKQFLLVPIQNDAPLKKLKLYVNNNIEIEPELRIAETKVDYMYPIDLNKIHNKSAKFIIYDTLSKPIWADSIHLSNKLKLNYADKYRPVYHFNAPFGWLNNNMGNIYINGKYHIFYQYYPYGKCWGEPMIGHAAGDNLFGWSYEKVDFEIDDISDINSGALVVDKKNDSKYGENAILYFYCKSNVRNYVYLNYSSELGNKFIRTDVAISIPEFDNQNAINPKVFRYEKGNKWIMLLSGGNKVIIMSSENLKNWKFESTFPFEDKYVETGIYNPDLVELNVNKNESKWVLFYNIKSNLYTGSAARYIVGDFDGSQFTGNLNNTSSLDYGRDFTSPMIWVNSDKNKKYLMGWMDNYSYANITPNIIYTNCKSLPRELSLNKKDKNYVLNTAPTNESGIISNLEKNIGVINIDKDYSMPNILEEMKGCCKIDFTVEPTNRSINIVLNNNIKEFVSIDLDFITKKLSIDRNMSGIVSFSPDFKGISEAPLPQPLMKKGSKTGYYKVSIYLDKTSVEVFINDGETVISSLIFPTKSYNNISLSKLGSSISLSDFNVTGFDFKISSLTISTLGWTEGLSSNN